MVRFWDTSAIVPLLAEESTSAGCRDLLRRGDGQIVWALTRTEALSALARRGREGALTSAEVRRAESRLEKLAIRWFEIDALAQTRDAAERLLRVHPLRAADAMQLGAALVAFDGRPSRRAFVCADATLLAAAEREGFDPIFPKS